MSNFSTWSRSMVLAALSGMPMCALAQVPPASIGMMVNTSGGLVKSTTPGTITSSYLSLNPAVTENALGEVLYGSVPYLHSYADMSGTGAATSDVSMQYFVQAIGPLNELVPIIVHVGYVFATVTRSGGGAYSYASAHSTMDVRNHNGATGQDDFAVSYMQHTLDQFGSPLDTGNTFVTDTHLMSRANIDTVGVKLSTQAMVWSSVEGNGIANAYVDPYFTIDPTFADASQFTLVVSQGVPNSPVPEPLPCLTLGAGLLAFCRRRK